MVSVRLRVRIRVGLRSVLELRPSRAAGLPLLLGQPQWGRTAAQYRQDCPLGLQGHPSSSGAVPEGGDGGYRLQPQFRAQLFVRLLCQQHLQHSRMALGTQCSQHRQERSRPLPPLEHPPPLTMMFSTRSFRRQKMRSSCNLFLSTVVLQMVRMLCRNFIFCSSF